MSACLLACGGDNEQAQVTTKRSTDVARVRQARQLARISAETKRLQRQLNREKTRARALDAQGERSVSAGAESESAPAIAGDHGSFAQLEAKLGGSSGLSVSPVGQGVPVTSYGTLDGGSAWSTMKVPVAIAAVQRANGGPGASTRSLLRSAITASDNTAAEQLWSSLGPPTQAGRQTQQVLAAVGDRATQVQTSVVRSGFSSFGQTQWALSNQQRFVAALPCLAAAEPILTLMGQTVADQRWGLAGTGGQANVKGGWGPGTDGRYLVRQMGIVKLSNGRSIAASMATIPADGSFGSGTSNLTVIAQWLVGHVKAAAVPAPRC